MRSQTFSEKQVAPVVLAPRGEKGASTPGAGSLGMALFLASLSVLFAGSLIGHFVVWSRAAQWPPPGVPRLPWTLWLSTGLLVGCSLTIQGALVGIRRGNHRSLMRGLGATAALAALFLMSQSWSWRQFFDVESFDRHLYGFTFYMLTGLHAAHVIGGILCLAVVAIRAWLGAYSWAYYPGVRYAATYWHFLGGVWLILFATLLVTS